MLLEVLLIYLLCVPKRLVAVDGRNLDHRVLGIEL